MNNITLRNIILTAKKEKLDKEETLSMHFSNPSDNPFEDAILIIAVVFLVKIIYDFLNLKKEDNNGNSLQ